MLHPLHQFSFCPKCGSNTFAENNEKSNKCGQCGFIFYFNISAAVAVLIVNSKNELLVCRRAHDPAKGTLDLPGGFVDMRESGEEAAKREVKEETGLEIKQLTYLFSLPNNYVYSDFEVQTLDMIYTARVDDGTVVSANDDVEEASFVPISSLNPADFGLSSIKVVIRRFKAEHLNYLKSNQ
ncbi:MAG: NUDIX domain-containing protein [Bacteroidales bacterium]